MNAYRVVFVHNVENSGFYVQSICRLFARIKKYDSTITIGSIFTVSLLVTLRNTFAEQYSALKGLRTFCRTKNTMSTD